MRTTRVNTFVPNYCTHPRQNRVDEEWLCVDCGALMDPLNPDRSLSTIADHALDDPWADPIG